MTKLGVTPPLAETLQVAEEQEQVHGQDRERRGGSRQGRQERNRLKAASLTHPSSGRFQNLKAA